MLMTPAEFAATAEKFDKINVRARKRGFTGELRLRGDFVTHTETGPGGLPVKTEMVEAEVTGEPPKYEGWTFLARVEFDPLVTYPAPGVPAIDRDSLREGACDHCRQERYRRHIFVVANDAGDQMQVGSTCLKDFLGWSAMPVWISEDLNDHAPDGGYGHTEPTYSVETILAAAWAAIQVYGYVRSGDWNGEPTKYTVDTVLNAPRNAHDREIHAAVLPHIDGSVAQAKLIREFILSDEFSGGGDYVANLKSICASEFVSYRKFGYLVSAPQAWARHQERTLIRKRERAEMLNEWNGAVGDRLTIQATLTNIRPIYGDWGTSQLYTFVGDDKREYKWFSTKVIFESMESQQVTLTGTVKKLEEYRGRKSTMLSRCKVS